MVAPDVLERIYGAPPEAQLRRYSGALDAFYAIFGSGPVQIFRAPGRVNLIGEHTDYNHGFVLPLALDRDVLLLARARPDSEIHLHNIEGGFPPSTFLATTRIPPAAPGDWSNYARGAAQMVSGNVGANVVGMNALVSASPPHGVPRGAGLSSSSALTVVCALGLATINDWLPGDSEFAQLCSDAEWYVGTRGGIMDQFISLLARTGSALFLDCRPSSAGAYTFAHVPLPAGYHVLVVDSGVHHANARGEFNLRVAACRAGVACLRDRLPAITHLRDAHGMKWSDLSDGLPESMTVAQARGRGADLLDIPLLDEDAPLRVRACCRHVHGENHRVRAMVSALESGDIGHVGRLLHEAHASARDDYQISCPEIEALVAAARAVGATVGARLTGAGWGGSIVALVRNDGVQEFASEVPRRYRERTGLGPTVFPCLAGGAAAHVANL